MGTATAVEITVIIKVDIMNGAMPNVGGSDMGYHLVPNRNSQGGVSAKIGSPSFSKMKIIPSRTTIASIPARNIQPSMILSPNRSRRFSPGFEAAAAVGATFCCCITFLFYLYLASGTKPESSTTFCPASDRQ